jgi:hypothetical protein
MNDEREQPADSGAEPLTPRHCSAPDRIDRRSFFRGAAVFTVGGLSGPAAFAQVDAPRGEPAAQERADAGEQLDAQTSRSLRWAGREPADWVRARNAMRTFVNTGAAPFIIGSCP